MKIGKTSAICSLVFPLFIFPSISEAEEESVESLIDEYDLEELLEENQGDYLDYGSTSTFSIEEKQEEKFNNVQEWEITEFEITLDKDGHPSDLSIKNQYTEDEELSSYEISLLDDEIGTMDAIYVPTKSGGGSNLDDFITPHSQRHAYDPNVTSTSSRTLYGPNVDVKTAREITYSQGRVENLGDRTRYSLEFYPGDNLSTSDTPTSEHRYIINDNDPNRTTQFPRYPN